MVLVRERVKIEMIAITTGLLAALAVPALAVALARTVQRAAHRLILLLAGWSRVARQADALAARGDADAVSRAFARADALAPPLARRAVVPLVAEAAAESPECARNTCE